MPKNISNRDIIPGQTLYQYLKRKKQVSLKQSIQIQNQKSRHGQTSFNPIDTKRHVNPIQTCRSFQLNTRRFELQQNKENQSILANQCKSTQRNNIQTYEISYKKENRMNENNQKSASRSKSFIEMISPLKNKSNFTTSQKQRVKSYNQKNTKKGHQIHNKTFIEEALQEIQNKIQTSQMFEKDAKGKIKMVKCQLSSLLEQIQNKRTSQINQEALDKKIKQIKASSKLLQNLLKDRKFDKNQKSFQKLSKIIYQNLNYFQADASKMVHQQAQSRIDCLIKEYQQKIKSLQKQNDSLNRSLQLQDKKILKVQKQYNSLLLKFNKLSEQTQIFYQKNQTKLNDQLKKYQNQVFYLQQQLKAAQNHIKQLNSEVTHHKYKNQQQIVKLEQLHKKKWFQKESFYVKQIQTLKAQYEKQICKFDDYNFQKQDKNHQKIVYLQRLIQKTNFQKRQLEDEFKLKKKELQQISSSVIPLKSKNQNLLTDLYRMNQQLYQHWLALKDIKTLLTRLNLFDKFSIIYRDLKFNEKLFA